MIDLDKILEKIRPFVMRWIADYFGIVAWSDYSSTSTVVGWSSFAAKKIWYCKIWKIVFISLYISGTSNNTTTTCTLPYATVAAGPDYPFMKPIRIVDNGSFPTAPGLAYIGLGSSTVTYNKDLAGAAFTNTGDKSVLLDAWYITT